MENKLYELNFEDTIIFCRYLLKETRLNFATKNIRVL